MRMLFLYGPPASGKPTIGRIVADRTGFALFHNHLVVDAVAAGFPFGSDPFVRLRERFWPDTVAAAAQVGRSIIFTFAPEPTVAPDFPARLHRAVEDVGGTVVRVALDVDDADQEARLTGADRAGFGKLRSLDLLRALRPALATCPDAMPPAALRIDTGRFSPSEAAEAIGRLIEASADTDP